MNKKNIQIITDITFITIIFVITVITIIPAVFIPVVFAGPQSATYELKEYGFGSGGEASMSSTTYSMFGTAGETDMATASSNTYTLEGGLILTIQAAVPPAPTVTNPGTNYDRLHIIIQTGGNPVDTLFAISISDGVTTRFIQNDRTMGSVLGEEDWLPYVGDITVGWGGVTGFYATNLQNNTPYTVQVKAKQGAYTESAWGPGSSIATADPTFTFGVDTSAISFSNLNTGNAYTDSSQQTILTTSTNAYNGYLVYGYETQPLTHTINNAFTIANYGSENSAPTPWTGTGFGYSTSDDNVIGTVPNRFTNEGPNYAGFTTTAPGDPVADHPGPILSPIAEEHFTLSYRVTADANTKAGQYKTTVIYVAVPTY